MTMDSTNLDFVLLSDCVKRTKSNRILLHDYEPWELAAEKRMKQRAKEKRKRHNRQARREVIAIDGEGVTDPDGSHRYTLLASSTGSYVEAHSLSTVECIRYLVSLPRDPILISFAFRYDVAMICRDIKPDVLEKLWRGEWIRSKRYAMQYIPGRVLIVEDRWIQERREIYDVFGF